MVASGTKKAISDLEYDLLAVLKNKSEAVELYNTYKQDAEKIGSQPCAQLFDKLQQTEMQQVEEIRHHLQQVMQNGKM